MQNAYVDCKSPKPKSPKPPKNKHKAPTPKSSTLRTKTLRLSLNNNGIEARITGRGLAGVNKNYTSTKGPEGTAKIVIVGKITVIVIIIIIITMLITLAA